MIDLEDANTLGKRFKYARQYAHLTQTQMAESCGISRSAVSQIESDTTKNLSPSTARALKEQFNVNVEWLITGHGQPYTHNDASSLLGAPHSDSLTTEQRAILRTQLFDISRALPDRLLTQLVDTATTYQQAAANTPNNTP